MLNGKFARVLDNRVAYCAILAAPTSKVLRKGQCKQERRHGCSKANS